MKQGPGLQGKVDIVGGYEVGLMKRGSKSILGWVVYHPRLNSHAHHVYNSLDLCSIVGYWDRCVSERR